MYKKDYRFVIPVSQTEWLEVNTRLTTNSGKFLEINSHKPLSNNFSSLQLTQNVDDELANENLPDNLFDSLSITHQAIFQIFQNQRKFMVATATGYQILHLDQIVCFEYIKERKLWEVTLLDESTHQLKRNTNADDILQYSLRFIRINQQIVINVDYLRKIEDNLCRISVSVAISDKLTISRNYMKSLLERVEVI